MGDELTIYAKILATLSGQGFTQAEAGLGKTEKAAKRAAGELLGAEAAGKQLGRTLQQYLGAAVLGNLVKTSVVEFARYERSLAAIGKQIDTLGGNAGDSLPQVRAFLETLERTSASKAGPTAPDRIAAPAPRSCLKLFQEALRRSSLSAVSVCVFPKPE